MKRIGLMTCFLDNYGACLQAYALQQVILKSGNDVEIIKYIGEQGYEPDHGWKKWIRNPLTRWIKGKISLNYRFYCERKPSFDSFRKRYLKFTPNSFHSFKELQEKANLYDAFVCGSDQIWNPNLYHGNNSCYFLDFANKGQKRIAYAPSIGISQIPKEYQENMKELLNRIDVLSCREKTGSNIITKLCGKECRTVLDPTLLLSKEEWEQLSKAPILKKPYIFCYVFAEQEYIGDFIKDVKKKTGLPVVTIPFSEREHNSDFQEIKYAGPEDFIGLIQNASLVITDSFHATAFSCNLNIPFYSLLRNKEGENNNMNSRILDLLRMLKLDHRLITNRENFPVRVSTNIDFSISNKLLQEKRNQDKEFLFNALK